MRRIGSIIGSFNEPNSALFGSSTRTRPMTPPRWIWQQPDWPQFHWQAEALVL